MHEGAAAAGAEDSGVGLGVVREIELGVVKEGNKVKERCDVSARYTGAV